MVKTEKERVQVQAARASAMNRRLSRPPSFSKRMWTKFKKFMKHATSGNDRLPKEEHWGKLRTTIANIIFSHIFEAFMGIVILFNILLIIIETDARIQCTDPESLECPANAQDLVLPDQVCLGIYCLELSSRIFVYQRKFCLTRWNVFDTFIVVLSILGEVFGGFFKDAVVIRVIRVTRLVRMLRLLTLFQELYLMMAAMASTVRTIFWATVMLMAVLSVQALVAVELLRPLTKDLQQKGVFEACPRCCRAFDSVLASMITFFQTLLIGEGVNDLLVPMMEADYFAGIFILTSTIFVYLGLSNLILSVIVEKANEARTSDSFYTQLVNKKIKSDATKELMEYWKTADLDMSETISLTELRITYDEHPDFRAFFISQDMDLTFLEYAFELGLKGGKVEDSEVTFEDFAEAVITMKNSDVGPVTSLIKCQVATIINEITALQSQVLQLTGDLSDHMAINSRAYNVEMVHSDPCMSGNSVQEGAFFGSSWWSRLSGYQPVNSKQAEAKHVCSEHGFSVHASRDVDQVRYAKKDPIHLSEDPIHQSEEDVLQHEEEWAREWSDDPFGGTHPQEPDEPGYPPRSGGPDLAGLLKSAYGNPLPLDLPNLDDIQRNFAKLCERMEAQLDRLDGHWIDDMDRSRAQSKKEVYAAGARLLDRLCKSMTRMLNEHGPRPPKAKLRRNLSANGHFGQNVASQMPSPLIRKSPAPAVWNSEQSDVAHSRTSADVDAHKAPRRQRTPGTRSGSLGEDGHEERRKGRRIGQKESRGSKD